MKDYFVSKYHCFQTVFSYHISHLRSQMHYCDENKQCDEKMVLSSMYWWHYSLQIRMLIRSLHNTYIATQHSTICTVFLLININFNTLEWCESNSCVLFWFYPFQHADNVYTLLLLINDVQYEVTNPTFKFEWCENNLINYGRGWYHSQLLTGGTICSLKSKKSFANLKMWSQQK